MRDDDRFFYLNDPVLETIEDEFGISYRKTLADAIVNNMAYSTSDVPANVFVLPETEPVGGLSPSQEGNGGQDGTGQTIEGERNNSGPRNNRSNNEPPLNRPRHGENRRPDCPPNNHPPRGNNR